MKPLHLLLLLLIQDAETETAAINLINWTPIELSLIEGMNYISSRRNLYQAFFKKHIFKFLEKHTHKIILDNDFGIWLLLLDLIRDVSLNPWTWRVKIGYLDIATNVLLKLITVCKLINNLWSILLFIWVWPEWFYNQSPRLKQLQWDYDIGYVSFSVIVKRMGSYDFSVFASNNTEVTVT